MDAKRHPTSFLNGVNATFVAELYGKYLSDPASVDPEWTAFFTSLGDDAATLSQELHGASWAPSQAQVIGAMDGRGEAAEASAVAPEEVLDNEAARAATLDSIRALMLIRAFRVRGHLIARLDPLQLDARVYHPELDPYTYGFTEEDYDREIFINYVLGLETATLNQILEVLQDTYCGSIGVEFMHIQEPDEKAWIQKRIESIHNQTHFTEKGKQAILERITEAEGIEKFLDRKYTSTKRFGLDGGESAMPALEQILKKGGQLGLKEVVLGMPHRGRLNVLTNVMCKPFAALFSEFQGNSANPEDIQGSGDVKYHLGTSADRDFDGHPVHLSLTANPSHLEAVNSVVLGKVRAKQMQREGTEGPEASRNQVMGLLLHGDAAFAGQGLVPEALDLSQLKGYRTGGTIHFIVNNQIGFTTNPSYSRSSPYCSDIAKAVQAPIFHVNGDDPEAVVHVARIAIEFRQKFNCDAVIDMICYRRFGHNEGDEPAFTQPHMYKRIGGHPSTRELYAQQLASEGVVSKEDGDKMAADFQKKLDQEFAAAAAYKPDKADWLEGTWSGIETARAEAHRGKTAVPVKTLKKIGRKLTEAPETFNLHPKITRQNAVKRKRIESGEGIDWATGEALAFGTLLAEGTPVRLSGQDCGRGTFSQRHAVFVDQRSENRFVPLNNLDESQAYFEVIDSPLSEAGVLGFEYGYTLTEPHALVLWEAQFGDFANGAQVIIDQFITTGESKWLRMSGLVMMLPHGFEGQGPEHSSARIERYLQLCAEDNIQVANCTTPASLFHILRRQMRRPFRKPLVIFTPKSLLRNKLCVSSLKEMGTGSSFHRVLYDNEKLCADSKVKRVVLCSGKVYYDLFAERAQRKAKDIFFLRLEQLYPFPAKALTTELSRFPKASVVWCQEEPKNMGPWTFMAPRIEGVMGDIGMKQERLIYAGRREAASPATGLMSRHKQEQEQLVDEALTLRQKKHP
ncbi:MAG: 2-oxoglutarate dehydrogenase E1 component [Alphaproteobacteria bacterium]|nr:2-oxoglutarate dehydrogenase E1 component [Alphaproteobacteria bacterium]